MWSGGFTGVIETGPEAVCDAGPVIHLDELGCIDLLTDFSALWIPQAVRKEIEFHRPGALDLDSLAAEFVTAERPADAAVETLIKALSLDRGEQAALSFAQSRPSCIFLTDDAAARLAAKTLGVRVHGTLGVLLRAARRGKRSRGDVLELLRTLPSRSSLHIRRSLLVSVIRQVETS